MAEQATTESKSTIVLDDPVCSLDHNHRRQVAKRLAQEGLERQIIIFTHDLAFLFLLEEACGKQGTNIAYRWVLKTDSKVGLCKPYAPPRAQSVGNALESLKNDLSKRKHSYENGDHGQWRAAINHYQTELRNLWERAVEDSLSPVIKRFKNKVDTSGFGKVTVLTKDDHKTMREGFRRCSSLLHSDGDELNLPIPEPKKIQEEIDAIKNWIGSIKGRQGR